MNVLVNSHCELLVFNSRVPFHLCIISLPKERCGGDYESAGL